MIYDQIFSILGVIVNAPLVVLILRHYARTRYKASLVLALHFLAFMGVHLFFVPVPFLGQGDVDLARSLLVACVFTSLAMPCLTIAFFETTLSKSSYRLLILFISYFAFLAGFSFGFEWTLTFRDFWFISLENTVIILYMIPFAVVVVYVFVRLVQAFAFTRKLAQVPREQNAPQLPFLPIFIWTTCLLFRYLGLLLITIQGITWYTEILFTVVMLVMALVYLYDPSAFFFSSAQIQAIAFFDANSGLAFYWFGQQAEAGDLKVTGLHGADTLLKELAGASSHPHLLTFIDRVVILQYEKIGDTTVAGMFLSTEHNPAFGPTLKEALSLFVKDFEGRLTQWDGNRSAFESFTAQLINVFDYAFPKKFRQQSQNPVKS